MAETDESLLEEPIASLRHDAAFEKIGLESLAWSPARDEPIRLDPLMTVLSSTFDGVSLVREVIEDLAEIFDISEDLAGYQLGSASNLLRTAGLLSGFDEEPDMALPDSYRYAPDW